MHLYVCMNYKLVLYKIVARNISNMRIDITIAGSLHVREILYVNPLYIIPPPLVQKQVLRLRERNIIHNCYSRPHLTSYDTGTTKKGGVNAPTSLSKRRRKWKKKSICLFKFLIWWKNVCNPRKARHERQLLSKFQLKVYYSPKILFIFISFSFWIN